MRALPGLGAGAAALLAALLAGCGEPPALEVGDVGYTAEEVGVLGPQQRTVLASLTAFGLAVAGDRIDSVAAPFIERDLRSLALQRLAMEVAAEAAGLGEERLRQIYERRPEQELVVRHLVVVSERWRPQEHRDSARARAREALERARSGDDFAALAGEYSDEPGAAERGGLLDPGRRGSWVPEFWEAAEALQPGAITDVVETEYGFHVIRLEERRPVPFEEAREEVLQRLVELPRALSAASDWAARQLAAVRVDTAALLAWRDRATADPASGAGEAGEAGDAGEVAQAPGETPLVVRPDGTPALTARQLDAYVATLGDASRRDVDGATPRELTDVALVATRNRLMAGRAAELGLEPSPSERAGIERRWRDRLDRWAEVLGFQAGQSTRTVKQLALEALGTNRQQVAIARSELSAIAGVLRRQYPVRDHAAAATDDARPAGDDGQEPRP